jgi:hypothetical protein
MRLSCRAVSKKPCPHARQGLQRHWLPAGKTEVRFYRHPGAAVADHGFGFRDVGDNTSSAQYGNRCRDFLTFSRFAPIFQLTTIVQVALRHPLSICHLLLPGKHSARVDQRDDRLIRLAQSRPGDRS